MRWVLRLSAVFFACIVLVAVGLYFYLRLSLPKIDGEIRIAGISGQVEIMRDAYGIPHIYAASVEDANFALGYVHAQDRLWQMEMNRRIAAGRLAEILGAPALDTDRFLRTLGVHRVSQTAYRRSDVQTRRVLDAYAAGVNAFIASDPVLPPEFLILRHRPEPWTAADSIAWTKMMSWDLSGNWRSELLRLQLAKRLPVARLQEFLPPYPGDAPVPLPDLRTFYGALEKEAVQLADDFSRHMAALNLPSGEGLGSNNWVVAGRRSESGKPLLANDPHLRLSAPAVWYFAHLDAPGLDAIGATLPGVPMVILGRNARIAWGSTNTGPDVQDLYLERLDNAGNYATPDGAQPFATREERIMVKGAEDVRITVRSSRHGPIVSDVLAPARAATPRGYALAFAWTTLAEDDLSIQSIWRLPLARNWEEFTAELRDFASPQQNIVYADVDGNIGFIAPGRVPVRKRDNDLKGLAPAPGWDARYDWSGYIPFDELPRSYNPASAKLWTANEKIVMPGYPHHITSEWQEPYRSDRIGELLEATAKHNQGSFARMHADVVSLAARALLPRLRETKANSDDARKALRLLGSWQGEMLADRAEPLILWAWWRELSRAIYADELGEAFAANWLARAQFLTNVLNDKDGQSRWCDNIGTAATEGCAGLLADTLESALVELRKRYGEDMAAWKWGPAHAAHHEHSPFGRQKFLARWFDFAVPTPGDSYTVNVGRMIFSEDEPFANRHAASLRAIYDLADPEKSLFIHSGGQSGNRLSQHYDSFSAAWARGEYIAMSTERKLIERTAAGRLKLTPLK
ncbi:MAG: penicillin acylase family protein [Betaproteobacteria bacterium]|nr:penicillin acylase family protein [Betaproteobacteria bacterium]